MSRTTYLLTLLSTACIAGAGIGVALGELHRNVTAPAAVSGVKPHTYESRVTTLFRHPRLIARAPTTLERLAVTGHGGTAVIEWTVGSWAPATSPSSVSVALYLDGQQLSDTVTAGRGGDYDARPGLLRWIGYLAAGRHRVDVRLVNSSGPVFLPLTVGDAPVQEGLDVVEHVG